MDESNEIIEKFENLISQIQNLPENIQTLTLTKIKDKLSETSSQSSSKYLKPQQSCDAILNECIEIENLTSLKSVEKCDSIDNKVYDDNEMILKKNDVRRSLRKKSLPKHFDGQMMYSKKCDDSHNNIIIIKEKDFKCNDQITNNKCQLTQRYDSDDANRVSINNEIVEQNHEKPNNLIRKCNKKSINSSAEMHNKPKRKWRRAKDASELTCKICGKLWRSLSHLEIHMRSHTGERKYVCSECGTRFVQLAGLQVHMRRHANDRPFKCENCEKSFYTKIDLNRHENTHETSRTITCFCEICGKGFYDNRRLKNHIRYVHEKKDTVVCEICGHKTHGLHLLYAHKRVKHGELTKHACPVCKLVVNSRNAFVIHMRSHADVRPCKCDICGKQFRSSSQVARHKLVHREGRHECDICLKKFKTPHHLRRHKVIHSGDKPFNCHLCEYRCNVSSNILKHVKSVHGLSNFSMALQQTKRTVRPGEEEALEKGTIVAKQVLQTIAKSKGEELTLETLKVMVEEKRREKGNNTKNNVKKKVKTNEKVQRKDILDDAIISTIHETNENYHSETVHFQINQNEPIIEISDVSIDNNYQSHTELLQSHVLISSSLTSAQVYELSTQNQSQELILNEQNQTQLKDMITLHFNT